MLFYATFPISFISKTCISLVEVPRCAVSGWIFATDIILKNYLFFCTLQMHSQSIPLSPTFWVDSILWRKILDITFEQSSWISWPCCGATYFFYDPLPINFILKSYAFPSLKFLGVQLVAGQLSTLKDVWIMMDILSPSLQLRQLQQVQFLHGIGGRLPEMVSF